MRMSLTALAIWGSTAAAVIAGMYYTGSAWCLWAMFIPALVKISARGSKDE